ncbi:hypothetical protein QNO21_14545 [Microbacterium sp. zg-Y818]|uniref:hypothetical protein n=1 Tax=unclassified Microbacterium TaxID=2609290 RepID=UPI00214AE6A4|nr:MULTISPECIES: hypothetical protein [unclassified Microbacterium]MCR2800348.1 hypothetical protein [Microbacterium sp. zg.Y818]WIM22308.1 hypothetical protein QNO21_14545 [Microbacterium sp. zg-Y818]
MPEATPAGLIAPIPGNPDRVRRKAEKYQRMADAITDATAQLEQVITQAGSQQSDALEALAESVGDTRERLRNLHGRYEVAGSQLLAYAEVLAMAQRQALQAMEARDEAQLAERRLEYRLAEANDAIRSTVDPVERTDAAQFASGVSQHLMMARADLRSAGILHAAAVDNVREAGNQAAEAIAEAVKGDRVNDSLWDKVSGAVKDWVSANAGWLSAVKNILGAITAIVGILSIFFPVLAPIALGLAAATALLSFGLAFAGEGSWLSFGLDMLGVLTFGIGAVAAKGVGFALRGTQVLRGLTHNRQATSLFQRIVHPISTRRSAIAAVGDEFQRLLPAGQQLMTRMPQATIPQKFTREWLELSGRQVEQFRAIMPQAQLGANGLRASFVEGMGHGAERVFRGAEMLGSGLDITSLGLTTLENLPASAIESVPYLDDVASGWTSAKESLTGAVPTNWQPGVR